MLIFLGEKLACSFSVMEHDIMNRIKDFIYDKNDLLIAFIIVAIAAFVIMSRVEVIMAYPTSLEAELYAAEDNVSNDDLPKTQVTSSNGEDGPADTDPDQDTDSEGLPSESGDDPEGGADDQPEQGSIPDSQPNNPSTDANVGFISIYIEYGATGSQIAQLLVDSGLISSREVFYDAVTAAGADTKLQAGNFKIPSNATPADIIRIITN